MSFIPKNQEIITIGLSLFNLTDTKPLKRMAIIPRDFENISTKFSKDKYIKTLKKIKDNENNSFIKQAVQQIIKNN